MVGGLSVVRINSGISIYPGLGLSLFLFQREGWNGSRLQALFSQERIVRHERSREGTFIRDEIKKIKWREWIHCNYILRRNEKFFAICYFLYKINHVFNRFFVWYDYFHQIFPVNLMNLNYLTFDSNHNLIIHL